MPLVMTLFLLLSTACGSSPKSQTDIGLSADGKTPGSEEVSDFKVPTSFQVTYRELGGPQDSNKSSCSRFHRAQYDGISTGLVTWGCADSDGVFVTVDGNITINLEKEVYEMFNYKLSLVAFAAIKPTYPINPRKPDNPSLNLTLKRDDQVIVTTFPAHSPTGFPKDLSSVMEVAASQNFLLGVGFTP